MQWAEWRHAPPLPLPLSQVLVLWRRSINRPFHVLVQPARRVHRCGLSHAMPALRGGSCRPLLASVSMHGAHMAPTGRRSCMHVPVSPRPHAADAAGVSPLLRACLRLAADGPWKPWEPPVLAMPDYCHSTELSAMEREVVAYANHP